MNKKASKSNSTAKTIIKWFWFFFGAAILSIFLVFFLISQGFIGYMPPVEDLENPIDKYASQIITADGKQLDTYSRERENRIYVGYNDLSPDLIKALIATEDVRFTSHSGIDAYALVRAFVKTGILQQKSAGGGSTITQQLAKQLYSPKTNTFIGRALQKPIEWVISVKLEKYYTKEEIVNLYLNQFDFLHNAVGIRSAAWVYFGKTPKTLTIEESATLVGMCKNPSYFNPIKRNEQTKGRRNVVLDQMWKCGDITSAQRDSLKALPLTIVYNKVDHKDGLAPYFREYLRMIMTAKEPKRSNYSETQRYRYSEDSLAWATNPLYGWCNKNKKSNGNYYNLYSDGLRIYTTIDSKMQQYATEAVREHIGMDLQKKFTEEKKGRSYAPFTKNIKQEDMDGILNRSMKQSDRYRNLKKAGLSDQEIKKNFNTPTEMTLFSWDGLVEKTITPMDSIKYMKTFLRSGMMSMDAKTGAVKAYVGGIDFQYFQYDMVNMGKRQIGSTIKPFLYALAMEEGMTPCDEILHVAQTLETETGKPWTPRNANKKRIGEMVTIKWGLQNSDNWITANLMSRISPYAFVRTLYSFGLKAPIEPVVSLCLGPCDISIAEMVSAYSTFANSGIRVQPVYVTRIEDTYGNTIASFPPQMHEVLSEESSYKMLDMLRSVVDGGTGSRLRFKYNITAPMGAKTGTTQNNSDGWFMAFTPSLVSGVWVGGEDRDIHFDTMTNGQAASTALPVYALFMKKVYADKSLGYSQSETFEVPSQYSNPCARDSQLSNGMLYHSGGIDEIFE